MVSSNLVLMAREGSGPVRVSIYGAGQIGRNIAELLSARSNVAVLGPYGRPEREHALGGGADVVVIATTSFLTDVADDIRIAVEAGSNVITSAEEAACPWVVDAGLANALDELARSQDVTVLGAGLNPGFAFDALTLTMLGAAWESRAVHVERTVDLSGFGATVLRRIGIGYSAEAFATGTESGKITGHIGFPQSMAVVARGLGVEISAIRREIEPLFAVNPIEIAAFVVEPGRSAGFKQRYTAVVGDKPWFVADFVGHVAPAQAGLKPYDAINVDGVRPIQARIEPGLSAQHSSAAVIANSISRIVAARPGWLTVGDLPPASPR
jgi:2,4-diaminopentanoate dehydrogenase